MLYAAYTVDTVYAVDRVYTVDQVFTVKLVFTVYMVYTCDIAELISVPTATTGGGVLFSSWCTL